ncbi:MAG: tetratricopeptide repeat protein [Burkholderiales bacterium]|nr:tetratricopeptide repeat protein [Burkholderiales bacterium]
MSVPSAAPDASLVPAQALQRAVQLHQAGRAVEALPLYAQVLAAEPHNLAALYYGGVAAWTGGEAALALARLSSVVELSPQPVADAHYHRALALVALGRDDEAMAEYQRTITLKPGFAAAHNNLGGLLRQRHDYGAADAAFAAAMQADPALIDARYNRALTAMQRGDLGPARALLQDCLKRAPDHDGARATLVDVLNDLGERGEALTLARASAKRLPKSLAICNALGQMEDAAGNVDAARAAYRAGLAVDAGNATLTMNLAALESENANPDAARAVFDSALAVREHAGLRLRQATLLPSIPASEAAIDHARAAFVTALRDVAASGLRLDDPVNDFGDTPFYLSYHGRSDDRDVLAVLASTLRQCAPELVYTAPHVHTGPNAVAALRAGKRRIGVCSSFLFNHSVGRAMHAILAGIPRDEFDVHLFLLPPFRDDALARQMQAQSTVHRLPFDLHAAREIIAGVQPDLLLYPEIGMEALTYFLAHARLAPVQWNTLGHPCTSGLPTIDAYVSYAVLEPPGSEAHYSERLLRLDGLPFPDYPAEGITLPPPAAIARTRQSLRVPVEPPLLICPQSLFKLMPAFDDVLRQILDANPSAHLLLPEPTQSGQMAAIQARFANTLGAAASRVRFFGRRSRTEFIELIAACDVLLDPFPVGGGISTWDALAAGTPVVTCPGDHLRSRFAAAALVAAGASEVIASSVADYVRLVRDLLTDKALAYRLRERIATAAPAIYADRTAVEGWVRALRGACATPSPPSSAT